MCVFQFHTIPKHTFYFCDHNLQSLRRKKSFLLDILQVLAVHLSGLMHVRGMAMNFVMLGW